MTIVKEAGHEATAKARGFTMAARLLLARLLARSIAGVIWTVGEVVRKTCRLRSFWINCLDIHSS